MTITNPLGGLRNRSADHVLGPQLALTGALAAIVIVAAALHPANPADSLMPMVVGLFFILAAAMALLAWQRPLPAHRFSYWDAAGILTFVGICLATTVEPEQMVRLVAGSDPSP